MNIGATIKAKRLALGMTQKQLAEKVFVDQSMICQIERGPKRPLYRWAKKLPTHWDAMWTIC